MHVLILGGTTEANALAALLAQAPVRATLSLAGRTRQPVLPAIPHRIGGFGGPQGLADWMHAHEVTALIDATHPFARRMPFHATEAATAAAIPLLSLLRPPWAPTPEDRWIEADTHEAALNTLGNTQRHVFLTVGRLELAAYANTPHRFLVRSIDAVEPKPLNNAIWLTGRRPFTVESERKLMADHHIEWLVSKNSGGSATEAKLIASRELGIPVILIRRPPRPDGKHVATAEAAMQWIKRVHGFSS